METQSIIQPINPQPFFTAYGPKLKVAIDFPPGFGRTKQSFKADADVNNIMQKYIKTGTLEFTQKHEARYGDATGIDFQHCMDVIRNAQNMFNDMPAQLRKRFQNDPAEFLDFIQEPGNQDEAVRLGLATSKQGGATPPAPAAPAARGEPQNRTADGQYTFDNPPSGPKGDEPEALRAAKRAAKRASDHFDT